MIKLNNKQFELAKFDNNSKYTWKKLENGKWLAAYQYSGEGAPVIAQEPMPDSWVEKEGREWLNQKNYGCYDR